MNARRAAAGLLDEVSRAAAYLADRLDPPRPPVRPEEREESRTRHPSTVDRPSTLLGDVSPVDGPLAEVVPFPRVEKSASGCVWHPEYRCETPTALCLLDCPRPEEPS